MNANSVLTQSGTGYITQYGSGSNTFKDTIFSNIIYQRDNGSTTNYTQLNQSGSIYTITNKVLGGNTNIINSNLGGDTRSFSIAYDMVNCSSDFNVINGRVFVVSDANSQTNCQQSNGNTLIQNLTNNGQGGFIFNVKNTANEILKSFEIFYNNIKAYKLLTCYDGLSVTGTVTLPNNSISDTALTANVCLLNATQTLTNKTLTDCSANTQVDGDNTTKIATTAFVKNQNYLTTASASSTYAPLSGATFSGPVDVNANLKANNITVPDNGTVKAGSFNATSDYRIKSNIVSIHTTHFSIDNLKPVYYFNTELKKNDMGFIAHEVQEEFPFLVNGEKDGTHYQNINYNGFIGLLVKEVQELKSRVRELEDKLERNNIV
jgi:hypothetical protein